MNKKKLLVVTMVLAMVAVLAVGGTLAYFTDTDVATNVFTVGNVDIDLTEAKIKEDENGDLVADGDNRVDVDGTDDFGSIYHYGKLYPAQTVTKDPTIENKGSEEAYLAAKVIVSDGEGDIERLIGTGYENLLGIQAIVSGGFVKENDTLKDYNGLAPVYGDATYSVYQAVETIDDEQVWVFYFFYEPITKTGDKITLFDTISIPADWDNAEMAELAELKIQVQAFGAQAHGFDTCFEAMTTAFPEDFKLIKP